MNKYWVSWVHKESDGSFELNFPWWCSGYDYKNDPSICAAIKAESIKKAADVIADSYDKMPKKLDFRFLELMPDNWSPFGDRFPKVDWMKWDEKKDG